MRETVVVSAAALVAAQCAKQDDLDFNFNHASPGLRWPRAMSCSSRCRTVSAAARDGALGSLSCTWWGPGVAVAASPRCGLSAAATGVRGRRGLRPRRAEVLHGAGLRRVPPVPARVAAAGVPDLTAWRAGRVPMTRARCWPGAGVMEDARARRWPRAGVEEVGSGVRGSRSVASAGAG